MQDSQNVQQTSTCLERLLAVIEPIRFEEIPTDVLEKSKDLLADFVGIFCNGAAKVESKSLRAALEQGGVISDPENLALWMGSTARMLDFDDGHRFAMAHPGVALVSTAVTMAMHLPGISGKLLLEALVKGYEVYCYQGRVINPSAYLKRGVDATCICGAGAAAMTAGTMMGLDRRQLADAISLAASLAGGLNQSAIDGSAQKYIVGGWGAKLGIASANLAKHGMGGPSRVFEGKLGFCNAFAPEPDWEYLNNPALVWDIRYAYVKMYACVRRIHATLDAVSELIREEGLERDQVEKILVGGSQFLFDAGGYDPKDMAQAQTSVPYAVALLLTYGQVSDELVHGNLGNKDIADYSRCIQVVKDPEIVALAEKDKSLWGAAKVTVTTTDGRTLTRSKIIPDGDPESPLPPGAVRGKFLTLAGEAVGGDNAAQMWEALSGIEKQQDAGGFLKELLQALL